MGKVVKLKESQVKELIKNIIEEQAINKLKKEFIINPGNAEAEIKMVKNMKMLIITTETGNTQSMYVKTNMPVGKFMLHLTKDNRLFGVDTKVGKKHEIFPIG